MYMKSIKSIGALLMCALFAAPAMAQQTYEEMEQLTVNEQVTTVITASEPVRFLNGRRSSPHSARSATSLSMRKAQSSLSSGKEIS